MGFFDDDFRKGLRKSLSIKNNPLPQLSGYKHGTPYVPKTKQYLVHKGEMVIPVKEATVLRRKMAEKKKKAPVKKSPVKKTKDKK